MKYLLLCTLLIFITGCEKTEYEIIEEQIIKEMGWLYTANPNDDFQKAIERNDFRFIGIYGVTIYTPMVSINCLNRDKDISPIIGTSDAVSGYEHAKLIAIAQAYAKDYNVRMLLYLQENKGFECSS